MMPPKVVRVGAAGIIVRDGLLLMGLRCGLLGPDTWSLPGGHVEFGEEPEYSVRREIHEETGLLVGKVNKFKPLPYVNSHFRSLERQYITLYFTAEYLGGEAKVMEPDKCRRWEWFNPTDLPQPLFEPMSYGPISAALAGLAPKSTQ